MIGDKCKNKCREPCYSSNSTDEVAKAKGVSLTLLWNALGLIRYEKNEIVAGEVLQKIRAKEKNNG